MNVTVGTAANITLPSVFYPTWAAISMLTLAIIGVIGNSLILVAIASEKSLRSKCHALMAALAFSDIITCIYLIQIRVQILVEYFYLNNLFCFYISMYGLCAQNLQSALGLTIGIDRFVAVFVPVSYLKWPPVSYIVALLMPSVIFAVALTAYGYSQTDSKVTIGYCYPISAFNGPSLSAWIYSNGVIVILVICTYSATAILVHRSKHSSTAAIKRVLGSLQVIVGVYCVSWALTILANFLIKNIAFSKDTKSWISMFTGWLVVINSSSNFFIYAWRSTDFRAAFAKIFGIKGKLPSIAPSGGGTFNSNRALITHVRSASLHSQK